MPCRPSASLFMLLVRQRMADEQRTTLILREKNEFFAEKNHFPRRKNHFPRLVHRSSAILCRTRSTNRDALGLQGTTSPQTSVHDCSHGHLLERVQPEPESLVHVWARTRMAPSQRHDTNAEESAWTNLTRTRLGLLGGRT